MEQKYYIKGGELFADPQNIEGMEEYDSPIWEGVPLPGHKNLDNLVRKPDGALFEFYKGEGTPDYARILEMDHQIFRAKRDKILAATDVMMIEDYTINDQPLTFAQRLELKEYRQSLKVCTKTMTLPTKPRWMK